MKNPFYSCRAFWALAMAICSFCIPAKTAAADDGWKADATIYGWMAGIAGTSATGGDIDIPINDILNNLDMTFMGSLEARNGKWGLLGDVVYLKISAGDSATEKVPVLGPITIPVKVDADVSMTSRIVTLAGTYNIVDNGRSTLSLVGGARYFSLDLGLELDLSSIVTNRSSRVSVTDSVWDVIVGARGQVQLDDRWYVPYHVDFGAGNSDLTWQAVVGIGYKYSWGDLMLAYRHLDYDFKSGFPLRDTNISGPALGARFFF